uniref:ST6 beta-galactosamide alpha-2,6-sialyltranferase 2a n=1 Tax=Tetraodon nigroviridis TaxID=99883 RepID=H3C6C8_TETNG
MKSCTRQWRRLVLAGMLAWGLLFLFLLSYFLDTRVNPLTSAGSLLSQLPDTRRLASIQASQVQHSSPDLAATLTATYTRDEPGLPATQEFSPETSHAPFAVYGGPEEAPQDYLDPQSLAAWSSFGTENIGSQSDPGVQSRERTSQDHGSVTRYRGGEEVEEEEEEEEEGEVGQENEDGDMANGIRTTAGRKPGGDSSDLENYYFSKSISVVQRLWQGRVSAGMLSPRLQRAMKDYVTANKHHVSYRGRRSPGQTAKELLCELQAQARLQTVDGTEPPFSSLGWARLVPALPLDQLHQQPARGSFNSCAVVTSAGAILRSGLGKEIGE